MRRSLRTVLAPVLASLLLATSLATGANAETPEAEANPDCPWVDSDAPVEERVQQLLSRMTLSEKLDMVSGAAGPLQFIGPTYAGMVSENARLCIPQLGLTDGPAGVGNGHTGVTQLPSPMSLAASWDDELAAGYGALIGRESLGKGADVALAPTVDLLRDPRAGRSFETLGEDPHLTGAMAAAQIEGIQGEGVMAQAKHIAAYNQETLRNLPFNDSKVDERTLQEVYLSPVQAVVDAGVASVMCSYNRVNGVHACNNSYLLNQVLKGQFGFDGFVTSDWFATQASHAAANAGMDMQMPGGCHYGPRLRHGINSGAVTTAKLDDMVSRILRPMFEFGLFERDHEGSPDDVVTNPDHEAVARQVAEQGMTLLKNDGGGKAPLPISDDVESVAVLGDAAGQDVIGSGGGSPLVTAERIVTPFEGIAERAEADGIDVAFDDGKRAGEVAGEADVAVVAVSKWSTETVDNRDIALSDRDNKLIAETAAANPNTVVVLNTAGPVEMPWLDDVAGVLAAWYPGQEYGSALASVLFGDSEPGGRLPATFPVQQADVPAASPDRFPGGAYDEGLAVGYRWYDREGIEPLFPFGFGLSYTTFDYDDVRVEGDGGAGTTVSAEVTNTGERTGSEVAQLYVTQPESDDAPPKRLEGFQRVELEPGQSERVSFELDERSLAHWDTGGKQWVRSAGEYTLSVGGSSQDLPLTADLEVAETTPVSEPTPPPPPEAPEAGDPALTVAGNVARCPDEALYSAVLGGISLFGLPPGKQAEEEPANPTAEG
ncbi:glycosyl hydrolase [Saccharomonospora sp. CUA-673]|uniref:beta-glucosidase family protein n=1 Tax=Saccharomonospora sp. CUA-673 TaxID=1904969 RepID=UPI0009684913|nr:glycoside hydrolase family 3 C-terminal domain-containing protein [Saccharomonospora sp. CUA-673]OLT39094.1 glycosyl hydrolase [Saccharomonospora sp. CUA-673]